MALGLVITFLIIALIAYVLGARGVAGLSMKIAWILVVIFVVLAILSFFLGGAALSGFLTR